jgi:hypothetical protein
MVDSFSDDRFRQVGLMRLDVTSSFLALAGPVIRTAPASAIDFARYGRNCPNVVNCAEQPRFAARVPPKRSILLIGAGMPSSHGTLCGNIST